MHKTLFQKIAVGAVALILGCPCTFAYEMDSESLKLYESLINSDGSEWLCYWELGMPVGTPGDVDSKVLPGRNGISKVRVTPPASGSFTNMVIESFNGDYDLNLLLDDMEYIVQSSGYIQSRGFEGYGSKASYSGTIISLRVAASLTCDTKNKYLSFDPAILTNTSAAVPKATSVGMCGEKALRIEFADINGYGYFTGLKSITSRFSGTQINGDLEYVSSVSLVLFKKNSGLTAATITIDSEVTAHSVLASPSDATDSNRIAIHNLYNKGIEYAGAVSDFDFQNTELTASPIILEYSISDGSAKIADAVPGIISMTPIPGRYNRPSVVFNAKGRVEMFNDYILLSESEYDNLTKFLLDDTTEATQAAKMKTILDRMKNHDFRSPEGAAAFADNYTGTNIWDTPEGLRPANDIRLEFGSHYLVPIKYYKSDESITDEVLDQYLEVLEGEKIESLVVTVPGDMTGQNTAGPTVKFEIEEYVETAVDGSVKSLRLKGVLNADAQQTKLYIVRGTLNMTNVPTWQEASKGHKDGLLVSDGTYNTRANISRPFSQNAPAATETTSTGYDLTIPDADIPAGQEPSNNTYTLYAGYVDADGTTRYRELAQLNGSISTGTDIIINDCERPVEIDGRQLTTKVPAQLYDRTARLIVKLEPGKPVNLAPGIYIYANDDTTLKIAIN